MSRRSRSTVRRRLCVQRAEWVDTGWIRVWWVMKEVASWQAVGGHRMDPCLVGDQVGWLITSGTVATKENVSNSETPSHLRLPGDSYLMLSPAFTRPSI